MTTLLCAAVINVGARDPLALGVLAPSGDKGKASLSSLIDTVAQTLAEHTDLSVSLFEASVVTDCAGNLGCVAARVDRAAPYVMLISVLSEEGAPDRLSVVVLDAARARAVPEDRAYEEALLVERIKQGVVREADATQFLRELIALELRGTFEQHGRWHPFGKITVASEAIGASIALDGRVVGTIVDRETVLSEVRLGSHALALEHPDKLRFALDVVEVTGDDTRIEAPMIDRPHAFASTTRTAAIFGGAAAALAGGALAIVAISKASTDSARVCLHAAGAACPEGDRMLVRSGFDSAAAPAIGRELNEGFALAPLGAGLFAAGATWAIGTLFLEPEERVPWIALLAGVALGGGAYVSVASF